MAVLKIYSKEMRREPFGNTTTRTITVMHDEAPIAGATVVYVLNVDAKGHHQSHMAFAVKEDALKHADELLQHSLKKEGFELLPDPV